MHDRQKRIVLACSTDFFVRIRVLLDYIILSVIDLFLHRYWRGSMRSCC